MHKPVMLSESIKALVSNPDGCYIDGTLGGGGHCREILSKLSEKGRVIGFDQDLEAINRTKKLFENELRLTLVHDNFSRIKEYLDKENIINVDGIFLDLGVSSFQIDSSSRGFSFLKNAPLDMRMNQQQPLDAKTWINQADEKEMENIFLKYGEEKYSKKIAKAISQSRKIKPLETTYDLVNIVKKVKGEGFRSKIHPATKTFQAIRIAINNELVNIEKVLKTSINRVYKGGRFVVLTFHSLEDRIVKHFFSSHIKREISLQQGGSEFSGNKPYVKWLYKKPLRPNINEINNNPRARSVKLRAVTLEG